MYDSKIADQWKQEAEDGRIYLHCTLDEAIGQFIVAQLRKFERDNNMQSVLLDINTNGGRSSAMNAIAQQIRRMKTPVETHCDGFAYSAGLILLASGKHRTIGKYSSLMFHGSYWGLGRDKSPDNVEFSEHHAYLDEKLCEYMASLTKKPKSFWCGIVKGRQDRYITPDEALAWGVVDKIV